MRKRDVGIGQYCRVVWDDTGASDGLVVEKESDGCTVFDLTSGGLVTVPYSQILCVGRYAVAMHSGLPGTE
jgi:hypothetical protein